MYVNNNDDNVIINDKRLVIFNVNIFQQNAQKFLANQKPPNQMIQLKAFDGGVMRILLEPRLSNLVWQPLSQDFDICLRSICESFAENCGDLRRLPFSHVK